jgi:hypothetical protein
LSCNQLETNFQSMKVVDLENVVKRWKNVGTWKSSVSHRFILKNWNLGANIFIWKVGLASVC